MKANRIILVISAVLLATACEKDSISSKSIFDTTAPERNAFDEWLYQNYVLPYNIQFNYTYEDRETDNTYNLVPADLDKAKLMAQITKYLWIGAYDELLDEDFMKTYCPRMIQLVGSKAYNSQGSVVLGTAEGGLKITLYNINEINTTHLDIEFLNKWFFHTMHHEFCHILHQTKNYSTDFNLISSDYQGPSWVNLEDADANTMGYVTAYASSAPDEDFVEIISGYITHNAAWWSGILNAAGETGRAKLERKFDIVQKYLRNSWGIDIDKLREIVLRRSSEVVKMKFDAI